MQRPILQLYLKSQGFLKMCLLLKVIAVDLFAQSAVWLIDCLFTQGIGEFRFQALAEGFV